MSKKTVKDTVKMPTSEIEEVQTTANIIAKIAQDSELFAALVRAHEKEDAETFQSILSRLGFLEYCERICYWICSKRVVITCEYLCPISESSKPAGIEEMRKFALEFPRLSEDKNKVERLLAAFEKKDVNAFQEELKKSELLPYCRQICAWISNRRCKEICVNLCPPPPLITHVGFVPTTQLNSSGFANGPSQPPGTTPTPNPAAGVGDHPFGGLANIRGLLNVANAKQYKVEYATATAGPWNPIVASITDFYINNIYPYVHYYSRSPSAGWYNVADMGAGSQGKTYLTDWSTPNGTAVYYLKLTVKNASNVEFSSPIVKVQVDNEYPTIDQPQIALEKPDGTVVPLGCCSGIKKGDGIIRLMIRAWDPNFSQLSLVAEGGCTNSIPIRDLSTLDQNNQPLPVSRTYNGNTSDLGEKLVRTVRWDPWAGPEKVESCCYLIVLSITDRALVNNYWSGGHKPQDKWVSLSIST